MKSIYSFIVICILASACFAGKEPPASPPLLMKVRYSTLIFGGTVVDFSVVRERDLASVTPLPDTLAEDQRFMLKVRVDETLAGTATVGEVVSILVGAPKAQTAFFIETFKGRSLIFFAIQDREVAARKKVFLSIHGAMDCWAPLKDKQSVLDWIKRLDGLADH